MFFLGSRAARRGHPSPGPVASQIATDDNTAASLPPPAPTRQASVHGVTGGGIGAQASGEGGAIAMILMSQKTVNRFEVSTHGWTLNGTAGLTVVNWTGKTQASDPGR